MRDRQHHNVAKGAVGHYVAIAKLVEQGLAVFQGYTDMAGVDLVIDTSPLLPSGGALIGVQVKSTDTLSKGFRIHRHPTSSARYYALIETRQVEGDERWWMVPTTLVHAEAATAGTKSTIRDLIWKPSEKLLEPFAKLDGVRELVARRAPAFHASRVGKIGEALGAAWLIKQGYAAYPTTADHEAIDLIVERGRNVSFVQVKFASSGLNFRNIRVPKTAVDSFVLLLVRGSPREYFLLGGANARRHRNAHGSLYLSERLRTKFKNSIGALASRLGS